MSDTLPRYTVANAEREQQVRDVLTVLEGWPA